MRVSGYPCASTDVVVRNSTIFRQPGVIDAAGMKA